MALADVTTEVIDLPDTWDKSNEIIVGGMRVGGSITNVQNFYPNANITAPSHGLSNCDRVAIDGLQGVTNLNSLAGQYYTVTVVDANAFTIPRYGSGTYTAGTGWWGEWIAK